MTQTSQDVPVLTVTQLTNAIKQTLEGHFSSIWLEGEISNCKLHSSGHLYFSIKDQKAQISAVMFRGSVSSLPKVPKDGDNVVVRGAVNVYPPSGKYQIVVSELRQAGLGELLLKLEELKKKIHAKGWFGKEHKKPLPKYPKTIGVITSPTGAVIQDILNVLIRRFAGFQLILNPVKVQGDGAAKEIAEAIQFFNQHELVDVIIVGRGGGSIEDLWAFNEEIVAEAIFQSTIPIICAVGHETDHCIAEYVADMRAPTPSAAAEIISAEQVQQIDRLENAQKQLQQVLSHLVRRQRERLNGLLKHPLLASPYALLGPWMQKIDDFRHQIDTSTKHVLTNKKFLYETKRRQIYSLRPQNRLLEMKQRLYSYDKQLQQTFLSYYNQRREKFHHVVATLKAIDPKNLLSKGYTILFSEKERSVITSVQDIKIGEKIRLTLNDGEALTSVEEIFVNEKAR